MPRVVRFSPDDPVFGYVCWQGEPVEFEWPEEEWRHYTAVTPWDMLCEIRMCLLIAEVPEDYISQYSRLARDTAWLRIAAPLEARHPGK